MNFVVYKGVKPSFLSSQLRRAWLLHTFELGAPKKYTFRGRDFGEVLFRVRT